MSRDFLCVWSDEDSQTHAALTETPSVYLSRRQGRASVLMPARPDAARPSLVGVSTAVFLLPSDTPKLLAALLNDFDATVASSTFLSYGHASVVLLLASKSSWALVEPRVRTFLAGLEIWSIDGDFEPVATVIELNRPPDQIEVAQPTDLPVAGLSFEAAAQVRQFNANLAVLGRTVRHYAPSVWPLITNLHVRVGEIIDQLVGLTDKTDAVTIRQCVVFESVLVETNAVTTLYCSQLGSGTLPLGRSRFPVGEYSLLGIGVPVKAAWEFYYHLSQIFAQNNHVGRLSKNLPTMGSFNWKGAASSRRDYSSWQNPHEILRAIESEPDSAPRLHIPHFSSRWGYHESLHSISLSWQSITASGTKEWNLLTLTHEFLHSQVRAIFAQILNPESDPDLAETIVNRYNSRDQGSSALQSIQAAYVETLVVARSMSNFAKIIDGDAVDRKANFKVPYRITVNELKESFRSHSELIQEVAVHVLDFQYVYASRPKEYVDSVWSSWSLVPSVVDKIDYYVLRTLCALSVGDPDVDYSKRFQNAQNLMLTILDEMNGRPRRRQRPAISAAIDVLRSEDESQRLAIQFVGLQYAVQLTNYFFYDSRINNDLLRDDTATTDGLRFTYGIEPGEYIGQRPESPVGFLLDRFPGYEDQAGHASAEFVGLWQMLQLA